MSQASQLRVLLVGAKFLLFQAYVRWERQRLRAGFWHARAINVHKCASLTPLNESR
jgi:hypothetical protein